MLDIGNMMVDDGFVVVKDRLVDGHLLEYLQYFVRGKSLGAKEVVGFPIAR